MRVKVAPIFILFLIIFQNVSLAKTKIVIRNQEDFSQLNTNLTLALKGSSSEIEVVIRPGKYYFTNKHILLDGLSHNNKSIIIKGCGAKIISAGNHFKNGDIFNISFSDNYSYITPDYQLVPIWSEAKIAMGQVEVLDENTKLCRIRYDSLIEQNEEQSIHSRIYIYHWFEKSRYKLNKIEDGYIYFTAVGLVKNIGDGWNVNDDYNYGQVRNVRFSTCNVKPSENILRVEDGIIKLPAGVQEVQACMMPRFCVIQNCSFKQIVFSGLTIIGSAFWGDDYLIELGNNNVETISFEKCTFRSMEGDIIKVGHTPNVMVKNCVFRDCYRGCIHSDLFSPNTYVYNCIFENVGLDFENSFMVKCQGENYHIANNLFRDYGQCAIMIGYASTRDEKYRTAGVVEYNTIEYTKEYIDKYKNGMLMDNGAIYVCTQNDEAVIRYNYINGHRGEKDNRGIFCDDGAYNMTIYGNIVTNIENSFCIDSRRVANVEHSGVRGKNVGQSNINNKIYDNIFDGPVRFEGREGGNNGCWAGNNYVIVRNVDSQPHSIYSNIDSEEIVTVIECAKDLNGKYFITKESIKTIKKSPSWKYFRKKKSILRHSISGE